MEGDPRFGDEPISHWLPEDFDRFLVWASQIGASDASVVPGTPLWVRLHGRWLRVTRRGVSTDEIMGLLDTLARSSAASARVKGGEDLDFSHEIKIDRLKRQRFRVNATACRDGWGLGVNLVLRSIPAHPPQIESLDIESDLLDHLFPPSGLVLVTGVMGSGKSTLLSACLRKIIEQGDRFTVTYEAPIEYDLMSIPNARGPIVQSEIPRQLRDFARAPRNSARRAADVILVGESRDRETLRSMIEAAEIGVAAYSTVHTRSVADTPSRIINMFPIDEQPGIAVTLTSALRVIVQQRLVPRSDSEGRVALREYLVLDERGRRDLMGEPVERLGLSIREKMAGQDQAVIGQDLLTAARRAFEEGLIGLPTLQAIERERSTTRDQSSQVEG
jgi:defect-in-organelle-trafficking protein DotB